MEDKLKYIFTIVNDWLKFAEAKNAALITLNGFLIFGLLQSWSGILVNLQPLLKWFFIPFSGLALVISFISFIPYLDILSILPKKKGKNVKSINIYYFGHLKDIEREYLIEILKGNINNREEIDLAQQIITNSIITWNKYQSFTLSATLTLIGAILTGIIFSIQLLF